MTPGPLRLWLLLSALLTLPVAAQMSDDGICSDADENGDRVLGCDITKITTDLDSAIPSATFWGTFCEAPVVSVGQMDGTLQPLSVLGSGLNFVTVDLSGNEEPGDVLFDVACPCESCTCNVTLGAFGPTGATGGIGPPGAQGAQGVAGVPGSTGPTGPKGAKGAPGAPGAQGPQGKQGPPGQPGPTGPTGATGPSGPSGSKGDGGGIGDGGGGDGGGGFPCNCCDKAGEGTTGCTDCASCETAVCDFDPVCCSVNWDFICDGTADALCTCCPGQDPGVCE